MLPDHPTADEILQQCLEDVRAGRRTPAECAAAHPELPELPKEIELARALSGLAVAGLIASPAAAQKHEARLRAAVAAAKPTTPRRSAGVAWTRWAIAAALVVALFAGGLGVSSASASSIPGHPLYPIKRAGETVEALIIPASGQAAWHTQLAKERTWEFSILAAQPGVDPALLDRAVAEIGAETTAALESVPSAPATEQADLLQAILDHIETEQTVLATTLTNQPGSASVQAALLTAEANLAAAIDLLSHTPGAPDGTEVASATPTATATPSDPAPTVTATRTPHDLPDVARTKVPTSVATRRTPPAHPEQTTTHRPPTNTPHAPPATHTPRQPTATLLPPTDVLPTHTQVAPPPTSTDDDDDQGGNGNHPPNCQSPDPTSANYCTPTPGPSPTSGGGNGNGNQQPNCQSPDPTSTNYCTPTPGSGDNGGGGGNRDGESGGTDDSGGGGTGNGNQQPNCQSPDPNSPNYCTPTPGSSGRRFTLMS